MAVVHGMLHHGGIKSKATMEELCIRVSGSANNLLRLRIRKSGIAPPRFEAVAV
jgi:hypothetical protein